MWVFGITNTNLEKLQVTRFECETTSDPNNIITNPKKHKESYFRYEVELYAIHWAMLVSPTWIFASFKLEANFCSLDLLN